MKLTRNPLMKDTKWSDFCRLQGLKTDQIFEYLETFEQIVMGEKIPYIRVRPCVDTDHPRYNQVYTSRENGFVRLPIDKPLEDYA